MIIAGALIGAAALLLITDPEFARLADAWSTRIHRLMFPDARPCALCGETVEKPGGRYANLCPGCQGQVMRIR